MQSQQKMYLLIGVGACILILISFFVGMKLQRKLDSFAGFAGRGMMKQGMFARGGMQPYGRRGGLTGQIASVSPNQLTIKLQSGVVQVVTLSTTTTYTKIDQASQSSLLQGQTVSIVGPLSPNGSIAAQSVRISSM